jgi:hypothetical protein
MTERERFKASHKHLDLSETKDAWDRPVFAHSHVEAMWSGWQAALESRVLAERKPMYQIFAHRHSMTNCWEDVPEEFYDRTHATQRRIVFAHP